MTATMLTVDTLGELLEKRTEINSDLANRWRWNGVVNPSSLLDSWNLWRYDTLIRNSNTTLGFGLFFIGFISLFASAYLVDKFGSQFIILGVTAVGVMAIGLLLNSHNKGLSQNGEGAHQIVLGFVKDMNAFAKAFKVPYYELAIISIQELHRMVEGKLISLAREILTAQATELYPSLSVDLMGLFDDLHKLFARFSLVEPKEFYFNLAKKDPVTPVSA